MKYDIQESSIIPNNAIPFYDMLKGYEWTHDFVRTEELQDELSLLRKEREKLVSQPISNDDFLELLKEQWQKFEYERILSLKKELEQHKIVSSFTRNVFECFRQKNSVPDPIIFSFKDVKAAVEMMVDGVPIQEKNSQIADIECKIEAIKAEIIRLSPATYFVLHRGKAVGDIRKQFVEHWRTLQRSLREPCRPNSIHLDEATEKETRAWAALVGETYINHKAFYTPRRTT
ncbi:MAG: hypothetical protein HQK78_14450 [Desulfobacterales bacterium]|nr:hypothetical protein [Desulfobacterales bacterium]